MDWTGPVARRCGICGRAGRSDCIWGVLMGRGAGVRCQGEPGRGVRSTRQTQALRLNALALVLHLRH